MSAIEIISESENLRQEMEVLLRSKGQSGLCGVLHPTKEVTQLQESIRFPTKAERTFNTTTSTPRQQNIINVLSKCCQKFFLFQRPENPKEDRKVRLRNELHRAEEVPEWDRTNRVRRRLRHLEQGWLTPISQPFEPVEGWPDMDLESIVLGAMGNQLTQEVKQTIHKHFSPDDIVRKERVRSSAFAIKDDQDLFKCPTAGLNIIRTRLKHSERRRICAKAGISYLDHLLQEREEKRQVATKPVQLLAYEEEVVKVIKERERRDELKFLEALNYLADTLLIVKLQHLKSTVPVKLETIWKEKDEEEKTQQIYQRPTDGRRIRVPARFKDQILQQAPKDWYGNKIRGSTMSTAGRSAWSGSVTSMRQSALNTRAGSADRCPTADDKEDYFAKMARKRWPPLWLSLAAAEEGDTVGDVLARPSKMSITLVKKTGLVQHKSLRDIFRTRREWARMRQNIEQVVEETFVHSEAEKLDTFGVKMQCLRNVPVSRTYDKQQRYIDAQMLRRQRLRQTKALYDCEVPNWYRWLARRLRDTYGPEDDEINAQLNHLKKNYRLSTTEPKFGKAKMALMVMSMPATVVCHIHVQRALTFLLGDVLQMPPQTLKLWLGTRGLPFVLVGHSDSVCEVSSEIDFLSGVE